MEAPEISGLEGAVAGPVVARRKFPTVNLLLFLLTIATTWSAGLQLSMDGGWIPPPRTAWDHFLAGLPFSASLVGILVCHEMGHFLTARHHKVDASWPYFIPVPLFLGTFGAVIRMRSKIPTRNALVDIGASGPLAGALVAVPLLIYGITLSKITELPVAPNFFFGNLSLLSLLQSVIEGGDILGRIWGHGVQMEPQPLLYVLIKKVIFHVGPLQDVQVHPVAFAGVIGLLITALNLVPIGQLDGGHVAFAALGPKTERLGKASQVGLLLLILVSSVQWVFWLILVSTMVGREHPPVERADEPLSPLRWVIIAATVLLFVLTLTPVYGDVL